MVSETHSRGVFPTVRSKGFQPLAPSLCDLRGRYSSRSAFCMFLIRIIASISLLSTPGATQSPRGDRGWSPSVLLHRPPATAEQGRDIEPPLEMRTRYAGSAWVAGGLLSGSPGTAAWTLSSLPHSLPASAPRVARRDGHPRDHLLRGLPHDTINDMDRMSRVTRFGVALFFVVVTSYAVFHRSNL